MTDKHLSADNKPPLEKAVEQLVKQYFSTIETNSNQSNGILHAELIRRVERELLTQVLKQSENNQSQTARILGISRTTLRKKLTELAFESHR